MRKIHDPYNPGFNYAVWLEDLRDTRDLGGWFRTMKLRGRHKVERTEVLFEIEEDALMFEIANI